MKNLYPIWALLLMSAMLFSCAKETLVNADSIAGGSNAAVADDGSDNGDEAEADGGNGAGSENGDEGTTPEEKPEFIDNNDWSAYDEKEYLIGFGAVDENTPVSEGEKATIDLSSREVAWKSNDRATVYVPETGAQGTYAYDATRQQFRPATPSDIVAIGNNLAYVYYPESLFQSYSNNTATVTMPSAVAADNVESLGDKLPMSGIIPANQGKAYPTVTFRNLGSVLRVRLTGCETVTSVTLSNTDVPLAGSGSVTWSGATDEAVPTLTTAGGATSMTVTCESPMTLDADTPTEFYFLLPSSGTMNGMTVRVNFTQSDGSYTYTPYIVKSRGEGLDLSSKRNKIIKLTFRAGFFSGGKGTAEDPYQIATPEDLIYLQRACSSYGVSDAQYGHNATAGINYFRGTRKYLQTEANIDLDGAGIDAPIGSANYHFFGSYDGGGNTISDVAISNNSYWVGLFGYVDGGTISNLTLSGCSVSSTNKISDCSAGALVGLLDNDASVSGCTVVSSTVTGVNCGGLVGYVKDGDISGSYAKGVTVTAANTTDGETAVNSAYCGGIAGRVKDGSVSSCTLYGAAADGTGTASAISGPTKVGGIIGDAAYDSGTSTLTACYVSNASITASGNYVGGLVGYAYSGSSINGWTGTTDLFSVCSTQGAFRITATGNYAGGVAGYNAGTITGMKTGGGSYVAFVCGPSSSDAALTGNQYVGGITGYNTGTLQYSYVKTFTATALSSYVGGIAGSSTGTITDCLNRYMTIQAYNSSTTTYGNYVGGLCGYFSGTLNNSDATADPLNNSIKGNQLVGGVVGYMASGTLTGSGETYASNTGTSSVQGTSYVGGIAGRLMSGTISSYKNGAPVTSSSSMVAGIVGQMENGLISQCTNAAAVTGGSLDSHNYIAGVVGKMQAGTLRSCVNSGAVNGTGYNVAGIAGFLDNGLIEMCRNTANVTATLHCVGGIAGRVYGGVIQLCYSAKTATITGKYMTGALGGYVDSRTAKTLIMNCAAQSAVTTTGHDGDGTNCSTGGLVGYLCSNDASNVSVLANCVSLGNKDIKNTEARDNINIGGIVGFLKEALVRNCYSTRTSLKYRSTQTAPNTYYGGVYGNIYPNSTLLDCYYCSSQAGHIQDADNTTITNHTKLTANQMNTVDKMTVTLSTPRGKMTDTYFRYALAYGASKAKSGESVGPTNLISYTTSIGTYTMSNWTRNEPGGTVSGLANPLPDTLYALGPEFYSY